jgi:hypothetical protein
MSGSVLALILAARLAAGARHQPARRALESNSSENVSESINVIMGTNQFQETSDGEKQHFETNVQHGEVSSQHLSSEMKLVGSALSNAESPRLSAGLEEPETNGVTRHNITEWKADQGPFDNMFCPGSRATTHAATRVVARAVGADCNTVRQEIAFRADNRKSWHDPSNLYSNTVTTYKVLSAGRDGRMQIGRTTPRFKFHDLINFELIERDSGCLIRGCSESQGYSGGDFHTNYCNIFNLICGSDLGCHPVQYDLATKEVAAFSTCGMRDYKQCLKYLDTPAVARSGDAENSDFLKGKLAEYQARVRELWENWSSATWEWVEALWEKLPTW